MGNASPVQMALTILPGSHPFASVISPKLSSSLLCLPKNLGTVLDHSVVITMLDTAGSQNWTLSLLEQENPEAVG